MRSSLPIGIFSIVTAGGLLAATTFAHAAAATWVSGTGSDAGNCPITAPCRTFAYAHSQTNNNGSINVLTPGNFGPLTITKPISIVAEGVEAMINTGAGGAAITVNAGGAAVVSLRGLIIDLRGTANDGISFISGAALHVNNSMVRRATQGIKFAPASGLSELYVSNAVIADIGFIGVNVAPTGTASAKVLLERVQVENSASDGILVRGDNTSGSVTAAVRDSVSSGNVANGILAMFVVNVMVERSALVNNNRGITATGAGATIRIGNSTVAGNANTGLLAFLGGVIESYGTNKVNGNGADGAPTSTILKK